ncbi:F-box/LRR-repeat protein like [Capsicum annuum]
MDRLATKNCVKELDFDIKRLDAKEDWYSLPGTVFTAKSLMVLRLRGLKLKWPLIVNHINLSKLKELSLTDVFLEEWIILEICSACPEIEDLRLIRFQGVKDLLTSDLPNLLKLTIEQPSQTSQPHTSIQIRAVFLHTLYFSGCNNTVKFDVSKFKHLKKLGITFGPITNSILENLVTELPLLEKLELSFCLKLTRLKLLSCVLKNLTFYSTKSLTEIWIDAPNLLHYTYEAPKFTDSAY